MTLSAISSAQAGPVECCSCDKHSMDNDRPTHIRTISAIRCATAQPHLTQFDLDVAGANLRGLPAAHHSVVTEYLPAAAPAVAKELPKVRQLLTCYARSMHCSVGCHYVHEVMP
jgi:hypothetical protein